MKCGYVALIGRPNVGKSTLMNHMLGQKISITSRKPQTTRHRIVGIDTTESAQIVYVDTPGMHQSEKRALNRYLNRTANLSLLGVNLVVWLIDGLYWQEYDDIIFEKLKQAEIPVILAINKVDKINDRNQVFDFFADAEKRFQFKHMIPVSALKGNNLKQLKQLIITELPESELLYPADQLTDRSERFFAAEIVREKLTRRLGDELPYSLTVEIERYEDLPTLSKIYAIIWVERDSQKNIVIGKQGQLLKEVGSDARKEIEALIGRKVYLQLWVKIKKGWSDNEKALQNLGFHEG